jgi:hypothetical protein
MPTGKMVYGAPAGADTHSGRTIALETKNLSRAIPGKVIVNDISVQVHQGEVLAVVGPSGAGKSSFLRLLNRLDEPTAGSVLLDGRDYREIAPRELRRRAGMVMQTPYLFPGRQHRLRSPAAAGDHLCRADRRTTGPGRLVGVSGTECEPSVRRRGATRVPGAHTGKRPGGAAAG